MRRYWLSCLLVALLAAPLAAKPELGSSLAATSSWNLQYEQESCLLARTFGSGDEAVTLYLRKTRPGPFFDMTLAGSRFGKPGRAFGTKAYFGDLEERSYPESVWISQASDGRPVLLLGLNTFAAWDNVGKNWIPPSAETLGGITKLRFAVPRIEQFTLASGPMEKPMAAVQTCFDDLMRSWGFDADTFDGKIGLPEPIGDPNGWIRSQTYPGEQLRNREGAILEVRLVVDNAGRVETCVIQNHVGDAAFAQAACGQLLGRTLFEPALDSAGEPARSLWFNSIRFQV